MSASNNPVRTPKLESANARLTDTVDFPTPPFPDLIISESLKYIQQQQLRVSRRRLVFFPANHASFAAWLIASPKTR
jgi:hypothetical protein